MLLAALPVLLFAQTLSAAQAGQSVSATYSGREQRTAVRIPRADADVTVDGVLDEPVWSSAARLTGFSLYQPQDGLPAPDSTDVLVWYSANALLIGIRAYEPHGAVRATLADRDRVSSDDNVEIHLDTFHDLRRAFVFIVNPLGVQADGTKSEQSGFIPGSNVMPGQNDLTADFLWESRGHVTPWGYEVEVRIPFRSLRYPMGSSPQTWGLQVVRNVQHSGYQQTWTPARRASASFIAQEGTLVGLTGMHHGQVVELNPELTNAWQGAPATTTPGARWQYAAQPALGGNVKWGIGSNFVLNGTVKPDFSQVEADALQIATDPRFALFYAEKRPFFVEGAEQFIVPNTWVYTRQIAHPSAAAKVTGRIGESDVALLSAVDDPAASRTGVDKPIVNILRVRRDFLGQSTMGFLVSDRNEGAHYNRLLDGDMRIVFGRLYFAQFQAGVSTTRDGAPAQTGPAWEAVLDRTGRAFGFHYNVLGVSPQFRTWNGFLPRTGFVQPNVSNRFTWYGKPGAAFERYNVFTTVNALWRYDDFFAGRSLLEDKFQLNQQLTFRGGWQLGVTPTVQSFAFDPAQYGGLYVSPDTAGPFVPFTVSRRRTTAALGVTLATPQWRRVGASAGATHSRDVDFAETSAIDRTDVSATVDWRPNERLRVSGSYLGSQFRRLSDGQRTLDRRIPRLKVEYQLARPVFVRFVGQYDNNERGALLDPATGVPLWTTSSGAYVPIAASTSRGLRVDWLFSYRPNPGTVFFAGYGSSLDRDPFDPTARFERTSDAFFVKASYVIRR